MQSNERMVQNMHNFKNDSLFLQVKVTQLHSPNHEKALETLAVEKVHGFKRISMKFIVLIIGDGKRKRVE